MLKAKAKTSAKILLTDPASIQKRVLSVLKQAADLVGSTLGPGGKIVLIENDYNELNHIFTKDGVTVLRSIGFYNSIDHVLIESLREAALKTVNIAGDGTTTTTILAYELTRAIFEISNKYKKLSPQQITRSIIKVISQYLIPFIEQKAIPINEHNLHILKSVILTSANGEEELTEAVMDVLSKLNFSPAAHITIKQQTGPRGYHVSLLQGYPLSVGLEESVGRFFPLFFTDHALQKGVYDKPKFLLYDGQINDLAQIEPVTDAVSKLYNSGQTEFKNLIIIANGFSEQIINALSYNINDPNTINVIPIKTPLAPIANSQTHILYDLSYYLNTPVYGIKTHLSSDTVYQLGHADSIELTRFRTTIIGAPNPDNLEMRVNELMTQLSNTEHPAERWWLEERLGKLTGGIGVITIYGGSSGELKEMHDRCEDAFLAAKSALKDGAVYGGGRIWLDMLLYIDQLLKQIEQDAKKEGQDNKDDSHKKEASLPAIDYHINFENDIYKKVALEILFTALTAPFRQLFINAGFNEEELLSIINVMTERQDVLFDLNKLQYVPVHETAVFDSATAVKESLTNAASIASVFGIMSGIIVYPRDHEIDKEQAQREAHLKELAENPELYATFNDHRG